ncbi:MAG: hypothetical protein OSJ43_06145 [Oscillospiraceae bacterium]|nr:hypothetical protein [Oscillospiraceae bacterium]
MRDTTVAVIGTNYDVETEQERELNTTVSDVEDAANKFSIANSTDYEKAGAFGRELKRLTEQVKDYWKVPKDLAHKAHADICAKEKAMLTPIQAAEKMLKAKMSAYAIEQERIRKEAEEAARKAAREAAERKLEEAVALSNAGNAEEADIALDESAIMEDMSSAITLSADKPKAEGVSTKKDWVIKSIDPSKVPVELAGIVIRPVDEKAVMRLIRASKGQIKIDGIEFEETVSMAFRK